ncbi:KH domain-containing protein [Candidatus Micrarchaeota archaeon]|nr:KH domain-containing protein [Candidatus Micrarchaeota archaeon]
MSLQLPIPIEEIEKGELSEDTRKKLREGKLSKTDINVSKALYEVAKEKNLNNIGFEKAIEIGDVIIITTKQNIGLLIGRGGSIASALSKKLNKKIRIIKHSETRHKLVSELIEPAVLKGINVKYTKTGKIWKILIGNKEKLPMNEDTLEIALKQFFGADIEIKYS